MSKAIEESKSTVTIKRIMRIHWKFMLTDKK